MDEQETARQRERVASLALAAAVIEALPDALIVIDVSGAIVMINERTELLFGYHRSELIGSQVEILLPAELRDLHAKKRAEYNQFTLSAHARTMGQGPQSSPHFFSCDSNRMGSDTKQSLPRQRITAPTGPIMRRVARPSPEQIALSRRV